MTGLWSAHAVRRIQPPSETLEIGFRLALFVLALLFRPGG